MKVNNEKKPIQAIHRNQNSKNTASQRAQTAGNEIGKLSSLQKLDLTNKIGSISKLIEQNEPGDIYNETTNIYKLLNKIDKIAQVHDYLVNLGLSLPFNRLQESEADYLGLAFMTMAKYDNHESYKVWQRMAEAQKGNAPPEFLSTHPSPKNRIEKLKNWIPEVDLRFT